MKQMAKRGRPRAQQLATLYDYRRMKTLIDVLAMMDDTKRAKTLEFLGSMWLGNEVQYYCPERLVNRLARHVLEHGREEYRGERREV